MRVLWARGCATRWRFPLQASFDALLWFPALAVATYLRYEFTLRSVDVVGVLAVGCTAAVLQVVVGRAMGLYVHRWRCGTLEEVLALARSVVVVGPLVVVGNLFLGHRLSVSATAVAAVFAIVMQTSGRVAWRLTRETILRPSAAEAEPLIVFGAGDSGYEMVRSLLNTPESPFLPVAVLDDEPSLIGHRLKHVSVVGGRNDIARVARATGARTMLVAIPNASGELLRELTEAADAAGLRTLVLPPVEQRFNTPVAVADIRPVTEADLLGRHRVSTDVRSVAGYLAGKRVLVTGAGGSIGSELVRQLHAFAPASIVMLDRDESALHAVQLSLEGRALLDREELVVACIRDRARLEEIFDRHRPEVVFHAAALKHLPLLEQHPGEGYKTNVLGTKHLLELSGKYGVERFVNVSTDKAADPTSVLGRSKRIAEQLTAGAGLDHDGTYLSVRFGNVLGSRGSAIVAFREQIERGLPVTVTHPDATRYFMTVEEACELVIQAGAIGDDSTVLVLDMGDRVRIADMAKRLVAASDRRSEIVYTGLRPGEKLHEVRFGSGETPTPTAHPLISSVPVPPLALGALPREDEFVDGAVTTLDLEALEAQVSAEMAAASGNGDSASDGAEVDATVGLSRLPTPGLTELPS